MLKWWADAEMVNPIQYCSEAQHFSDSSHFIERPEFQRKLT
jgi:hypothetical protein